MADDDREARAREAVRRAWRNVPWLFSKEGNRQIFHQWLERKEPAFVVQAAKQGDADAIDILRDYARGASRAGMTIPPELLEFALEYFIDGKPKAPSGSSPKDTVTKNMAIAALVKIVHQDFGFPEYRNSEWRGERAGPMTAPRLVGEEIGLSERTVEDIWRVLKPGILRAAKFDG